jgi:hypothetical protein
VVKNIFVLKVVSRMTSFADPTTAALGFVLARKRYVGEKNVGLALEEKARSMTLLLHFSAPILFRPGISAIICWMAHFVCLFQKFEQ